MNKQSKYINISQFESPDYPTTFIIGARGVGKTIHALYENIMKALETEQYFIYLRRFQIEIDTLSIDTALLSQLTKHDITTDTEDFNGTIQKVIKADGQVVGIFLALSVSGKYKSNSFANCFKVIYDEFLDIRGRYVKNEVNIFYNFMMTIFRDFRKYNILFLANATDVYNEYFLALNILPKARITKFKRLGVKIVMYETSLQLSKERENSPLALQYIQVFGDDNSALNNTFDNEFNDFLAKLTKKSKYFMTLKLNGNFYGLYNNKSYWIISTKADLSYKACKALSMDDVTNEIALLDWQKVQQIIESFKKSQVYFDNAKTRTIFIRFFKSPGTGGVV